MSLQLNTEQKIKLTIAPKTESGKPASLDGIPVWTSSDTSVIVLEPAADGLSAYCITTDAAGVSNVSVSADCDLGAGIETISATEDITVTHVKASNLGLTDGTPENK